MDLLRVDYSLIPDDPLFNAAIDASQAITDEFYYNANIIDAKKYPPHVSVCICGLPPAATEQASGELQALAEAGLPPLTTTTVELPGGGWVMLAIERTAALVDFHEAILDIGARAAGQLGDDPYATHYVRDRWSPHISLAKVDRDDQAAAASIARQFLQHPITVQPRALELCDIGERSERWDVLASLVPGTPTASR